METTKLYKQKKLYGLYDTQDNEVCMGIMTLEELAEMLGVSVRLITLSCKTRGEIMERYLIVRIDG